MGLEGFRARARARARARSHLDGGDDEEGVILGEGGVEAVEPEDDLVRARVRVRGQGWS